MRYRITTSLLTLLALLGGTSQLMAVNIKVQPVIREILQSDQTPLAPHAISAATPERLRVTEGTGPLSLTVDYYVSISALAGPPPEAGFGNVVFNVLTSNAAADRWHADATLVDVNGDEPEGLEPIWADNADYGASGTDLKSIIVGLAPTGFGAEGVDPRRTIAQNEPIYAGFTVVSWDPETGNPAGLTADVEAFSTYSSNLLLREQFFGGKIDGSLLFDVGPGQTGDTDGDGDVDIVDLNNVRNHFSDAGEGVAGDTQPFDGVVNIEDLNRVRDNYGSSLFAAEGMTAVPEPTSAGLAVFGLIALAGYCHRRHQA